MFCACARISSSQTKAACKYTAGLLCAPAHPHQKSCEIFSAIVPFCRSCLITTWLFPYPSLRPRYSATIILPRRPERLKAHVSRQNCSKILASLPSLTIVVNTHSSNGGLPTRKFGLPTGRRPNRRSIPKARNVVFQCRLWWVWGIRWVGRDPRFSREGGCRDSVRLPQVPRVRLLCVHLRSQHGRCNGAVSGG